MLPQTVKDTKKRNTLFAFYNMVGTFAMSAGVLVSGLPEIIQHQYGLNQIDSIRLLFLAYSILGIGVLGIYLSLSKRVEIMQGREGGEDQGEKRIPKPLTQTLSPTSKKIVAKLSGLFAIDSLAVALLYKALCHFGFLQNLEQI